MEKNVYYEIEKTPKSWLDARRRRIQHRQNKRRRENLQLESELDTERGAELRKKARKYRRNKRKPLDI